MTITLTTSGVVLGRRGRAVDLDAATDIIDYVTRGYIITVRSQPSTPYSRSYMSGAVFGRILRHKHYWFSENADLFDPGDYQFEMPDWVGDLESILTRITDKREESNANRNDQDH